MEKIVRFLIVCTACIPSVLWADDNSKYLAGAVPEVEGRVIFTKEFDLQGEDQNSIFERMNSWLDNKMKENNNGSRVVLADKEKGQIVATSEEYMVFADKALTFDRTLFYYNITAFCTQGKCKIQIERIRYKYGTEKFIAEQTITDSKALNKKKTSIFRGYKKFRIHTIDFVDDLFKEVGIILSDKNR